MGEGLRLDILVGPLSRHAWSLSPEPAEPALPRSMLRRVSQAAARMVGGADPQK